MNAHAPRPRTRLLLGDAVRISMRPTWVLLLAVSGCSNSYRTKTHAFVATEACGQGPFDVVLPAEATTGGEGMEVVACTPRRLAGHVEFFVGELPMRSTTFGDTADNQRCFRGQPVTVTEGASAVQSSSRGGTTGGAVAGTSTNLSERLFHGSETPFSDDLCKEYGLTAQTILDTITLQRDENFMFGPGTALHVRIWSDVPNDLEGVFFMVRQVIDNDTVAEVTKQRKKDEADARKHPEVSRPEPHALPVPAVAPPPPLAEERPPVPGPGATWVTGYWMRTGESWGWIAGFWRDDRYTPPAPQVEIPGEPPHVGALWIGGAWTLRAGAQVWISGRWR